MQKHALSNAPREILAPLDKDLSWKSANRTNDRQVSDMPFIVHMDNFRIARNSSACAETETDFRPAMRLWVAVEKYASTPASQTARIDNSNPRSMFIIGVERWEKQS
jgi:hypothetical protein